jgi:hypothetical protein
MAPNVFITQTSRARAIPYAAVQLVLMAVLLTVALALVSGARAQVAPTPIILGAITVGDGTAVVTGSVNVDATADADLAINGADVDVDASGQFSAVVDLDSQAVVVLSLANPGETITIRIPASVLVQLGEGALDALIAAGISIDIPADGLQIVDGNMPVITGRVLDGATLASLTINGRDVLQRRNPNGEFAAQLPDSGSRSEATVTATDKSGVSQTSTFTLIKVRTAIKTKAGTSVSSAGAQGLVIAKVRFDKRKLLATKRLGVIVTLKDRRGFVVRGAALRLKGSPLRYLANGAVQASFTNRLGQARFVYRLSQRALTNTACGHLAVLVRASTPNATAKKKVAFQLPMLARR